MADVSEVSFVTNIVDTIIKAGPTTTIFAWLYWQERRERIMLRDRLLETTDSVVEMNATWLKILPRQQSKRRGDDE
jgi:hypothetical protein